MEVIKILVGLSRGGALYLYIERIIDSTTQDQGSIVNCFDWCGAFLNLAKIMKLACS